MKERERKIVFYFINFECCNIQSIHIWFYEFMCRSRRRFFIFWWFPQFHFYFSPQFHFHCFFFCFWFFRVWQTQCLYNRQTEFDTLEFVFFFPILNDKICDRIRWYLRKKNDELSALDHFYIELIAWRWDQNRNLWLFYDIYF